MCQQQFLLGMSINTNFDYQRSSLFQRRALKQQKNLLNNDHSPFCSSPSLKSLSPNVDNDRQVFSLNAVSSCKEEVSPLPAKNSENLGIEFFEKILESKTTITNDTSSFPSQVHQIPSQLPAPETSPQTEQESQNIPNQEDNSSLSSSFLFLKTAFSDCLKKFEDSNGILQYAANNVKNIAIIPLRRSREVNCMTGFNPFCVPDESLEQNNAQSDKAEIVCTDIPVVICSNILDTNSFESNNTSSATSSYSSCVLLPSFKNSSLYKKRMAQRQLDTKNLNIKIRTESEHFNIKVVHVSSPERVTLSSFKNSALYKKRMAEKASQKDRFDTAIDERSTEKIATDDNLKVKIGSVGVPTIETIDGENLREDRQSKTSSVIDHDEIVPPSENSNAKVTHNNVVSSCALDSLLQKRYGHNQSTDDLKLIAHQH